MTTRRFSLEAFDEVEAEDAAPPPPPVAPSLSDEDLTRAAESAYQEGWDDCLANIRSEETRISEALGRRLEEIGIASDALRDAFSQEVRAFLSDVLEKIVPQIAHKTFAEHVLSILDTELAAQLNSPAVLRVSQEDLQAVQDLVANDPRFASLAVSADATLGLTQARLETELGNHRIDVLSVLDQIDTALAPALHEEGKISNG